VLASQRVAKHLREQLQARDEGLRPVTFGPRGINTISG
jgi:hypothetical protein